MRDPALSASQPDTAQQSSFNHLHVTSVNNHLWKVVGCRITMLAPSRSGTQIMSEICEKYAKETNLEPSTHPDAVNLQLQLTYPL